MLNEKIIALLKIMYVCKDNAVSIEYILELFNISLRQLQYYLKDINYYLLKNGEKKIIINNSLLNFDKESIKKLLNNTDIYELSRENKQKVICFYATFNKMGVNISKISELLDISRNTVKTYMFETKENFSYKRLRGYYLEKSNIEKSKILFDVLKDETFHPYIQGVLDENLLEKIKKFIVHLNGAIKLNLENYTYLQVLSYSYCLLTSDVNSLNVTNNFVNSNESVIIEKLLRKYFSDIKYVNQLVDLFVGVALTDNIDSWINENYLVMKFIKRVSKRIGKDLTKDEILRDFLLSHIKVCIYRLKRNISIDQEQYKDFFYKTDKLFHVIEEEVCEFEKQYDIKFPNEEITLLCFHINASIERMNVSTRKRVILVCGMGYGSSKVLEYNLKEEFNIDIVDILPIHMFNSEVIESKNVDYVLTTVDIDCDGAIKINPQLKLEDYKKLYLMGIEKKKNSILVDSFVKEIQNLNEKELTKYLLNKYANVFYTLGFKYTNLLNTLTNSRVIFRKKVKDWKDAILILGRNLEKLGATKKEYTSAMIENIEKLGPYVVIENGVAIPHANISSKVLKTDISFLILKEPVYFSKEKYASVLFAFSSINKQDHIMFLNEFYDLVLNPTFLKEIDKIDKYDEFITYIKERD